MRKIKHIFSALLIVCFLCSFSLVIKAWEPPKFNNKYEEEKVEFRSFWVATVSNIDIGKQRGTSPEDIANWQNQYLTILEYAKSMHMNAIIFQVRPCNDAFYPSKYNPWSEYLVGYGADPGWDPLGWMVDVTHKAGLEYHAWLNPYRASVGTLPTSITEKDTATNASYVYDYNEEEIYNGKQQYFANRKKQGGKTTNGEDIINPVFATGEALNHNVVLGTEGKYVLNPASDETITHLQNTIGELITNYDLDGIHFDDYFYPSNTSYRGNNDDLKGEQYSTEAVIDYQDYSNYVANGGTLSRGNWRRENVNKLIKTLSDFIRNNNKNSNNNCAFGISPSAHWAPSIESCPVGSDRGAEGGEENVSCNGYFSYSDLYADTYKWVREEWIDYILPQNYTNLGDSPSGVPKGNFPVIASWWSKAVSGTNVKLYLGLGAYRVKEWADKKEGTNNEIFFQLKYCQDKGYNVDGYVMFSYESLLVEAKQSMESIRKYLWKNDALTPNYNYQYGGTSIDCKVEAPKENQDGSFTFNVTPNIDTIKAFELRSNDTVVARILCAEKTEITFTQIEGITEYQLYAYGSDNQLFEDYLTVNLENALNNQPPTIVSNTQIDNKYECGEVINLDFTVTDPENDNLSYSLYAFEGNKMYTLVSNQSVTNNQINYKYETFYVPTNNMKFKLVVSDGKNESVYESTLFDVVEDKNPVNPPVKPGTGDEENKEDEPKDEKKGCKNCASGAIISIMSALSLLFIIRRKE